MKSLYFILMVILASSCQVNTKTKDIESQEADFPKDIVYYQEREYQEFQEYGFAIKAPCLLKDVSQNVSGEFLLNYGGITEKDNPDKIAFYQLAVNRLPVGYKDMPADKLKSAIDSKIKDTMKNLRNCKPILFGYEEYRGYVGECTTKGYSQKGVMFSKDNYIICLTVISNDSLEEKFNKFTNSFKDINSKIVTHKMPKEADIQLLTEIGYSVNTPCNLKKADAQGYDIYYDGAINGNYKEKAIVYKVMANKLPLPYSKMNAHDRKTIKQNLINYLNSKGNYTKWETPINSHMSHIANSTEQGFKIKEALILTDNMVIEFVLLSKLDIESDFDKYINSIKSIKNK